MQRLAEPFAWEVLVNDCNPLNKIAANDMQQELARLTGQGAARYISARDRRDRLRNIGVYCIEPVTTLAVSAHIRKEFVNADGEPTNAFKALLRKHPHTVEIICVLAAKAISRLPTEQRLKAQDEEIMMLPQAIGAMLLLCYCSLGAVLQHSTAVLFLGKRHPTQPVGVSSCPTIAMGFFGSCVHWHKFKLAKWLDLD